jgi:hypothetical protein
LRVIVRPVDDAIARDGTFEQLERIGAEAGKTVQLKLEKQRVIHAPDLRRQALYDHPANPATAIILKTDNGFDQAFFPD